MTGDPYFVLVKITKYSCQEKGGKDGVGERVEMNVDDLCKDHLCPGIEEKIEEEGDDEVGKGQ